MSSSQSPTPKETLSGFVSSTTIAPLPHAYNTSFIVFKVIWVVVFLSGTALTSLHIFYLVHRYLQYPTQVKVMLRHNESMEFPAVTVCNLSPVTRESTLCTKSKQLVEIEFHPAVETYNNKKVMKMFQDQYKERKTNNKDPKAWLVNNISPIRKSKNCTDLSSSTITTNTTSNTQRSKKRRKRQPMNGLQVQGNTGSVDSSATNDGTNDNPNNPGSVDSPATNDGGLSQTNDNPNTGDVDSPATNDGGLSQTNNNPNTGSVDSPATNDGGLSQTNDNPNTGDVDSPATNDGGLSQTNDNPNTGSVDSPATNNGGLSQTNDNPNTGDVDSPATNDGGLSQTNDNPNTGDVDSPATNDVGLSQTNDNPNTGDVDSPATNDVGLSQTNDNPNTGDVGSPATNDGGLSQTNDNPTNTGDVDSPATNDGGLSQTNDNPSNTGGVNSPATNLIPTSSSCSSSWGSGSGSFGDNWYSTTSEYGDGPSTGSARSWEQEYFGGADIKTSTVPDYGCGAGTSFPNSGWGNQYTTPGVYGCGSGATTEHSYWEEQYFGKADMKEEDKYEFKKFLQQSKVSDLSDVRSVFTFQEEMTDPNRGVEEFIHECSFDRMSCNYTDFTKAINKQYGNCYAFNSGVDNYEPINVTRRSGSEYGLGLTLNIQADQYVGLLAPGYGVRVSIHDPRVPAIPEAEGFVAAPGFLTSVGIQRKEITRLKAPYESNCTNEPAYKEFYHDQSQYSVRLCKLACLDNYLSDKCGCVEQKGNVIPNVTNPCSILTMADRTCKLSVVSNMSLPEDHPFSLPCDCPSKCHEVKFATTISIAKWPTEQYQQLKMHNFLATHTLAMEMFKHRINDYKDEQNPLWKDLNYQEWVEKNLVRLKIFYESNSYEIVEEQEAYPFIQLWADVGGVLGLYLGMSAVTAVEVVQLLLLLIYSCFRRRTVDPYGQ